MGKTIISLLFLSAFLFLRVANAHAFSHFSEDDIDTDCELCEIISVTQELTPFVDQSHEDTTPDHVVFLEINTQNLGYEEPRYLIVSPLSVYNKPPPLS